MFQQRSHNDKYGFTLAEVLITLGIIGIVAALTLPNLNLNYRNKVLETQFKKQYNIIQQGVDYYYSKTLCSNTSCLSNTTSVYKAFKEIVKVVNECTPSSRDVSFCFAKQKDYDYTDCQKKNSYVITESLDDYQIVLPDGALITFNMSIIGVDINGKQKLPNALGYDVFLFQMIPNNNSIKLLPVGADGTHYKDCSFSGRTSAYNGLACAYKALTEADYFKKLR